MARISYMSVTDVGAADVRVRRNTQHGGVVVEVGDVSMFFASQLAAAEFFDRGGELVASLPDKAEAEPTSRQGYTGLVHDGADDFGPQPEAGS